MNSIKKNIACLQCDSTSIFLKEFHDANDSDKLKCPLYKCLNCKLYFFNRDNYNQQIYKDYKLFANKIMYLINNPKKRKKMSINGFKRYNKYFTSKIMSEKYLKIVLNK